MNKKDYYVLSAAFAQAYVECKTSAQKAGAKKVMEHCIHAMQIEDRNFSPREFEKITANMIAHMTS